MQTKKRVYRLSLVIFIGLPLAVAMLYLTTRNDNNQTETEQLNEPREFDNQATATSSLPVNKGNSPDDQTTDLSAITTYLQSQGNVINSDTLNVWQTLAVGDTETIMSFSYTDSNNLPCIGLVIGDRVDEVINIYMGHSTCATSVNAPAIAGSWLLVTNDDSPISMTATIGEIFNPSVLVMSAGIVYSDGTNSIVENVENNRFLVTRTDRPESVTRVIFINEFGNIEADITHIP